MNRRIGQTIPVIFMILPLLLGFGRGSALAQTHEEIVEQFFPQRLIDESVQDSQKGGPEPFKTSNFVVADLNGDGSTFIIAAYSNGFSGVIRVLRKNNGTFSLVDEPNLQALSGDFPEVELLDLDNDGCSEVIVSFSSARGTTANWVFKWDGTKLDLIGPTRVSSFGVVFTKLSDASFIDIDGDGIREIVNPTSPGPVAPDVARPDAELDVYVLQEGKYVFSESVSAEVRGH